MSFDVNDYYYYSFLTIRIVLQHFTSKRSDGTAPKVDWFVSANEKRDTTTHVHVNEEKKSL